ncbi:hypothetical protein ACJJTC_008130 [Scirpophaga incertulas]
MCRTKLLLITLLFLRQAGLTIAVRKLLYQKDMSEYCRRRVISSLFLGQNLAEAHSQLLHFSKLELPYSCFITVRAELSSSIIMVLQLLSDRDLTKACSTGPNQLLVYVMGETFGGYWGSLPETLMRPSTSDSDDISKYIIKSLKTSENTPSETHNSEAVFEPNNSTEVTKGYADPVTVEDFITIELPIVNVSVSGFAPSEKHDLRTVDDNEIFDVIYDVTPRADVIYETSILPVVQFSIPKRENSRRIESEPRYNFKYDGIMDGQPPSNNITITAINTTASWEQILDSLEIINENNIQNKIESNDKTIKHILQKLANTNYNYSVYLSRNLATTMGRYNNSEICNSSLSYDYTNNFVWPVTPPIVPYIKKVEIINEDIFSTAKMDIEWKTSDSNNTRKTKTELRVTDTKKQPIPEITSAPPEIVTITSRLALTGNMVGRESWENVVRAAPVMAELLNQTVAGSQKLMNNNAEQPTVARRKRVIHPLAIENARPFKMTTKDIPVSASQQLLHDIFSMEDFINFIELQDDEIHDHVLFRYLRQYVDAAVFNICADINKKPISNSVLLINASRIVIAINNFTLQKMTLILTPAQVLVTDDDMCANTSLECQHYGTRLCIDKSNACDGVPNCGAYDFYDEDRLKCGKLKGLQHNVYIAATAFVAVILTILYSIHYWLKRCVPKVSEAFFVYTDTAVNILNLQTIMRAPNEPCTDSKGIYHKDFYDDDDSTQQENVTTQKRNIIIRLWTACFNIITCKIKLKSNVSLSLDVENNFNKVQKLNYSFPQIELNKIGKQDKINVSVQTGPSLVISEDKTDTISFIESIVSLGTEQNLDSYNYSDLCVDAVKKYTDELSILKLCKETRLGSLQKSSVDDFEISVDAIEKQNTKETGSKTQLYEPDGDKNFHDSQGDNSSHVATIHSTIDLQKPTSTKRLIRQIRFSEKNSNIPTIEEEFNKDNFKPSTIATNDKDIQSTSVISKDFKRFWNPKNKKSKKKAHVTLW